MASTGAPAPEGSEAGAVHRLRRRRRRQAARSGAGQLVLHLPRHLRDRAAQPGPADPLRDRQRARPTRWPNGPTPPGSTSRPCCGPRACRCSRSSTTPPAHAFDLLAFNLSAELVYTNLLNCIDLAGVPVRAADRADGHPLMVAGGHCTYNPEPLADFVDFFVLGDGEEVIGEITEVVHAWKAAGKPIRAELLRGLAGSPVSTCRRCTTLTYDGRRWPPITPLVREVPGAVEQAHGGRSRRLALSQATSWCRSPRWSTTASTSRCSGAAPGAAGSARPG